MPEKPAQSYATHARLDPAFHFVFAPAMFALLIWSIVRLVRAPGSDTAIVVLLVLLVVLMGVRARLYALKVQDRVIRLEERLRLRELLSAGQFKNSLDLTESQLIALRFACDEEVVQLSERALREKLQSKQIKEAIRIWRPDHWRV